MKAAEAEKADWLAKQNQAEAEKEKLAGELEASEKAYSEILNFSRQKMAEKQKLEQGLAYLDNEVRRLKGESSRREEAAKSIEGELQKRMRRSQACSQKKRGHGPSGTTEGRGYPRQKSTR